MMMVLQNGTKLVKVGMAVESYTTLTAVFSCAKNRFSRERKRAFMRDFKSLGDILRKLLEGL